MTLLEAIILGIIQGLSEFIPISSTAHLTLAGHLLGLIDHEHPEKWTAFIAVIQLGTLAAVLLYFSKEIRDIPSAFLTQNIGKNRKPYSNQSVNSRLAWMIILGTLPIVGIGLILKKVIESDLTKDPILIASSLIGLAIILAIAEFTAKFHKKMDNISILDAILIGFAQCIALIPGASRSGTTITAGLFLGLERESAARFSFLLSIPAVFASGILEFTESLKYISGTEIINLTAAVIASAISGYWSIAFLLKFLKTRSTMLFVVYRIILGAAVLLAVFYKLI